MYIHPAHFYRYRPSIDQAYLHIVPYVRNKCVICSSDLPQPSNNFEGHFQKTTRQSIYAFSCSLFYSATAAAASQQSAVANNISPVGAAVADLIKLMAKYFKYIYYSVKGANEKMQGTWGSLTCPLTVSRWCCLQLLSTQPFLVHSASLLSLSKSCISSFMVFGFHYGFWSVSARPSWSVKTFHSFQRKNACYYDKKTIALFIPEELFA